MKCERITLTNKQNASTNLNWIEQSPESVHHQLAILPATFRICHDNQRLPVVHSRGRKFPHNHPLLPAPHVVVQTDTVGRNDQRLVRAKGAGNVFHPGTLYAVLVGRLVAPEASEIGQAGSVATGRETPEALASQRKVSLDPVVGEFGTSRNRHRLAELLLARLTEARGLRTRAHTAHLATVAADAELQARITVGRLVGEVALVPNVALGRVANLQ